MVIHCYKTLLYVRVIHYREDLGMGFWGDILFCPDIHPIINPHLSEFPADEEDLFRRADTIWIYPPGFDRYLYGISSHRQFHLHFV